MNICMSFRIPGQNNTFVNHLAHLLNCDVAYIFFFEDFFNWKKKWKRFIGVLSTNIFWRKCLSLLILVVTLLKILNIFITFYLLTTVWVSYTFFPLTYIMVRYKQSAFGQTGCSELEQSFKVKGYGPIRLICFFQIIHPPLLVLSDTCLS